MDKDIIKRYEEHNVIITCKNGWTYKIFLKKESITETGLSFIGKHGEPIDFDFDFINFITHSDEGGFN